MCVGLSGVRVALCQSSARVLLLHRSPRTSTPGPIPNFLVHRRKRAKKRGPFPVSLFRVGPFPLERVLL